MAKQRGLGKGLSSLIPTNSTAREVAEQVVVESADNHSTDRAKCDVLSPNPFQPRKTIDDEQLFNLVASIKEHGVIQPILVRPLQEGFQIIAGERRWRAAKLAGLEEVPIRVLEISDPEAMELALVENLQREDLSSIEIAQGIQELITKLTLTHEEVAQKIGFSRTAVTNKLRLLQLPGEVWDMLQKDVITEGHARALLSLPTLEKIIEYAKLTVNKALNVRQLEQLVRNVDVAAKIDAAFPRKSTPESDFKDEIDKLNKQYRLSVKVAGNRKGMALSIKGLKKWQIQLLLEYIERNGDELFPRE
ncbi:MAG: ParB/RepB/Spo0J family partition protein [Synergistaceae bacterium]|jgi:ParB family chromosome partitioning protein|nr:ParB/RepB/Spo0J family partition protein [Synergistaceae bacterium]